MPPCVQILLPFACGTEVFGAQCYCATRVVLKRLGLIIIVLPEFTLLSYCYFLLMFRVSDVCRIYLFTPFALCFYDYSDF